MLIALISEAALLFLLALAVVFFNGSVRAMQEKMGAALDTIEFLQKERDRYVAETQRLTNIIVQLKQDGYDAPPWAGNQDDKWGSYSITNDIELREEERLVREDDAMKLMDVELREQLNDL